MEEAALMGQRFELEQINHFLSGQHLRKKGRSLNFIGQRPQTRSQDKTDGGLVTGLALNEIGRLFNFGVSKKIRRLSRHSLFDSMDVGDWHGLGHNYKTVFLKRKLQMEVCIYSPHPSIQPLAHSGCGE